MLAVVLSLSVVVASLVVRAQDPTGFKIRPVRFDTGSLPNPTIPKSWHFVGVSQGDQVYNAYLWFQDASGNIFMIRSGVDKGQLELDVTAHELASK